MLELFDELALIQRTSTELVVWSNLVMQLVTIAYPVTLQGHRVEPTGLREWLVRRGLHLSCFCVAAAPAGETRSSRIVTGRDEIVYAFCSHYPTRCNFFIDINAIYKSATLESRYFNLPTNKTGAVPDMEALRKQFMERIGNSPNVLNEQCPYFEGYCGEHISQYPGVTQSNSTSLLVAGGTAFTTGKKQSPLRAPRLYDGYGVPYNPLEKGKGRKQRITTPEVSDSSSPGARSLFADLAKEYFAPEAGPSSAGTSILSRNDLDLLTTLKTATVSRSGSAMAFLRRAIDAAWFLS